MFIMALNGSPHREGNTAFLLQLILDDAAKQGADTEMVWVHRIMSGQKKPYCSACASPCQAHCYKDTELEKIFERMKKADALVLGSPVYFGTVSSQLKGFWDKTRKLRAEKALLNKVAGAVSCGAARFGGQETTLRALFDMVLIQGMILVNDGAFDFDAGHHGVCAQQPSHGDDFARQRALILSRRLVEVARATSSLRK